MAALPVIDADAVRWSVPADERAGRPLLVLLHGYGSDERDLFALAPFLPADYVVASVRAPLAPPFPSPGYSWYPIEGLDGRRADDVTVAADAVLAWLDATTEAATDTATPHVGLLGFSQGAAVSLQVLRRRPSAVSFVVNLSGYVTPGELETDAALAEIRPPVFWGRGSRDDVIPEPLVAHTVQWLPERVDLSGRVYPGLTHSVSEDEMADVRIFLQKQLDDAVAGPSS